MTTEEIRRNFSVLLQYEFRNFASMSYATNNLYDELYLQSFEIGDQIKAQLEVDIYWRQMDETYHGSFDRRLAERAFLRGG